jgi:hypothetical protein
MKHVDLEHLASDLSSLLKALSVDQARFGWTNIELRDRARLVANKTQDQLKPGSFGGEMCSYDEIMHRLSEQLKNVENSYLLFH